MSEFSNFHTFLSVKEIQRFLNRWSTRYGDQRELIVDGKLGPNTFTLLLDFSIEQPFADSNKAMNWSKARRYVAGQQLILRQLEFNPGEIDGYYGPATASAVECWQTSLLGQQRVTASEHVPWPRERDCEDFYGKIGTNHTLLTLPYPMRLTWKQNTILKRISVNGRCAESLERVLVAVRDNYGDDVKKLGLDLFSGCYNPRYKRNGTTWSMHAYACALDFYHTKNRYRWHDDQAVFARPEYDDWWKCWEDEGWVSLGQERNFDWMHVQAAQL